MNPDKNTWKNPSLAVWELTLQCNLHCSHCGSSAGIGRSDELSTKEAKKVCKDLAKLGFKGVALMGGEVFLRDDWQAIAKEIKDQNMTLSVITNGFFQPNKIVSYLQKIHVDTVMIGLDGSSPKTHDSIRGVKGSFEKAMNFLQAAKNTHLPTAAITTVHKNNFHELPQIRDLLLEKNLDWQIQEATPIGRFPKKLTLSQEEYYTLGLFILAAQKKFAAEQCSLISAHNFGFHSHVIPNLSPYPEWNGCYAGKTILGIQSNGNIKGCLALPDEYIEGNIRNQSITTIWNNPNNFAYNRQYTPQELGNNCTNCPHAITCKGGCTTRSTSMTGIPHNDPLCFYHYENEEGLL